ncbi:MAG: hypothetical protein WCF67_19435 [Chitinophagaceae bacterium]
MSVMKTSGSRRKYVGSFSYSEERKSIKQLDLDNLPQRESIKSSDKFYYGKINFGLLVRFLRRQVGQDWDLVYSEIISRIPTKLQDRRDMIYWFVADKVEMVDGNPWNKRSQRMIWTNGVRDFSKEYKEFYVDPSTNKLVRVPDHPRSKPKS